LGKFDYEQARFWYEKAAAAGKTWAMQRLAEMYERGQGVSPDPILAQEWRAKLEDANTLKFPTLNWKPGLPKH
jgi:TPR repeat protein